MVQLVEVPVPSAEGEIMLQHQGRDPDVVGGDGGPLTAELAINSGVVTGCLVVGKEDLDTVADQELVKAAYLGTEFSTKRISEDRARRAKGFGRRILRPGDRSCVRQPQELSPQRDFIPIGLPGGRSSG